MYLRSRPICPGEFTFPYPMVPYTNVSIPQVCGEVIVQGCQSYLCDVRPEGVVAIVRVVERCVQLYPSHFPQLVQPLLPTILQKLLEEDVRWNLLRRRDQM